MNRMPVDSHWILTDEGHAVPCTDITEWAKWFETADRQVAVTQIEDMKVSTVFLGLDYSFGMGDKPLLFETMVFGGKYDGEQIRYATYEAAEYGHHVMVKEINEWIKKRDSDFGIQLTNMWKNALNSLRTCLGSMKALLKELKAKWL